MGTRIDGLQKNVSDLMTQAGMDEQPFPKWPDRQTYRLMDVRTLCKPRITTRASPVSPAGLRERSFVCPRADDKVWPMKDISRVELKTMPLPWDICRRGWAFFFRCVHQNIHKLLCKEWALYLFKWPFYSHLWPSTFLLGVMYGFGWNASCKWWGCDLQVNNKLVQWVG